MIGLLTVHLTATYNVSSEWLKLRSNLSKEPEPLLDEEIFLENLSMRDFFALPDAEQDRLWQAAHEVVASGR